MGNVKRAAGRSVGAAWLADPTACGTDLPWASLVVRVAGARMAGLACARVLAGLGAKVDIVDDLDGDKQRAAVASLEPFGVTATLGVGAGTGDVGGFDLVVTSPGWRPTSPMLVAAGAAGVPVWGEPELAWRVRGPGAAPWLVVTGTDGKTTTTLMLASILGAAGLRTGAVGNTGVPLVEVVTTAPGRDVLAVELGSFQLHWSRSIVPAAATVLNLAPDHLDWHGSFEEYAAAKAGAFSSPQTVAVGNADDAGSVRLLARAPGPRVTFTLSSPHPRQLGVVGALVDGVIVDRAFVPDPDTGAVELAAASDVSVTGAHNLSNALAAAALARAHGVPADAVSRGLRSFTPAPHRNAVVAVVDGVRYVDDSKATSPHAASASLSAYPSIVWVAGGLGKGMPFDEVVAAAVPRLRGAVLLGACRGEVRAALARVAPQVPLEVIDVGTGPAVPADVVMDLVVGAAARLARPGDTVLLAPAAASMDMFDNYGHRGDAFAAAVRRRETLPGTRAAK